MSVNDLEQQILAGVRRAADEFRLNGFEGMAITMAQVEREVRDLATIARCPQTRPASEVSNSSPPMPFMYVCWYDWAKYHEATFTDRKKAANYIRRVRTLRPRRLTRLTIIHACNRIAP